MLLKYDTQTQRVNDWHADVMKRLCKMDDKAKIKALCQLINPESFKRFRWDRRDLLEAVVK